VTPGITVCVASVIVAEQSLPAGKWFGQTDGGMARHTTLVTRRLILRTYVVIAVKGQEGCRNAGHRNRGRVKEGRKVKWNAMGQLFLPGQVISAGPYRDRTRAFQGRSVGDDGTDNDGTDNDDTDNDGPL
jgi:hypothetical protein